MRKSDTESVFNTLMKRPDINQAHAQYKRMDDEIREALSDKVSGLQNWEVFNRESVASGCGSDYPGLGADGESGSLTAWHVDGAISDQKYEQALNIIGSVAQRYGFNPAPQRLHDSAGSHDAVFHKTNEGGQISFGTEKNTTLRTSIECHLTPESKKRGHPSGS